jgi:hypothetical protein
MLVATATFLVAWLSVVSDHWLEQPHDSGRGRVSWDQIAVAAAWSTLACFAIACSFPFMRLVDWLVWPAAFAAAWLGPRALQSLRHHLPLPDQRHPTSQTTTKPLQEDDALPIQTLTRYRTADGLETIHAQLRVEFAPGDRDATLHIAFCPPFTHLPTVEAYLTDDIAADVKLTQVLHHGAQTEIRLPTPARGLNSVNLELIATESAQSSANS